MDALDTLRLFSDGQTSAFEARSLMESMGFTREEFAEAFTTLAEAGSIRISKYRLDELQADLFLTASEA